MLLLLHGKKKGLAGAPVHMVDPLLLATAARLVGAHSNLLISICGLLCISPNINELVGCVPRGILKEI